MHENEPKERRPDEGTPKKGPRLTQKKRRGGYKIQMMVNFWGREGRFEYFSLIGSPDYLAVVGGIPDWPQLATKGYVKGHFDHLRSTRPQTCKSKPIHGIVNIGPVSSSLDGGTHCGNPHIIASVSYYWRCVALETPRLWSTFSVHGCRGKNSLRLVRLYLERSKDAPLSITLDLSGSNQVNHDILHEIWKHAERWIDISIRPQSYLPIFAPVRGRLHLLKQIQIFAECNFEPVYEAECDALAEAPKLRAVRLSGLRVDDRIPALALDRIRTASFWHSANHYHAVPQVHRAAKKITLFGYGTKLFSPVGQVQGAWMMDILHRLTTPNLEDLRVIDCGIWDPPCIIPFMTRSTCPLRTLVLQNTRLRAGELLALLHIIPTLEILSLAELLPNSITDVVVTALTPLPGSEVALPTLMHITLVCSWPCWRPAQLPSQTVDLTLPDREVNPVDRARFAALQASMEFLRLRCVDEARQPVQIEDRRSARPQWTKILP
ncbi:hypothetical protein B0H14DRAFT_3567225 [Mycena olivaceomarginata]|nr:hypothetical protein B0H14DRAFT_3567225 [Mycena olivaceomarginata]